MAFQEQALGELAPYLPAELLSEALTVIRSIEDSCFRAQALGRLAPQLSGNLLQQGFEALLEMLPRCNRHLSLTTISPFFPFLGGPGTKGAG
jgi:hypothetical protein